MTKGSTKAVMESSSSKKARTKEIMAASNKILSRKLIRSVFLSVSFHLSRGQASLQVNPEVAEALIPCLHVTVLHDGRLCSPFLWKIRTRAHRNYLAVDLPG